MNKHSKKRNTGLLYEFLVKKISTSLVEGDQKTANAALKILKKHFKKGTELYKEFRLINSLVKTTVSSDVIAYSIISEVKSAIKNFNHDQLDIEKSKLIGHINHVIKDQNFYDQHINEYKTLATIQTLINNWKSESPNLQINAKYEEQLIEWLKKNKEVITEEKELSEESNASVRYLMSVMTNKINEKYNQTLTPTQRTLIKLYAYSKNDNADLNQKLSNKLSEIKRDLLQKIDEYVVIEKQEHLVEKLNEIKNKILTESVDVINESTIASYLSYIKLSDELGTKE